jgi:hypothetical protein
MMAEVISPGFLTAMPSAIVSPEDGPLLARSAGNTCWKQLGLRPEHVELGPQRLGGDAHPGKQPAAADRHTSASMSGASSSSSSATVPCPAMICGSSNGWTKVSPSPLQLLGAGIGLVEHLAVQHDARAMAFGLHHLDGRRRPRHHDGDRHAQRRP